MVKGAKAELKRLLIGARDATALVKMSRVESSVRENVGRLKVSLPRPSDHLLARPNSDF
jgi:hypothetical protein